MGKVASFSTYRRDAIDPTYGIDYLCIAIIALADGSMTVSRHEEYQYLDLIREIIAKGEHRPDRTGTGTLSLFAPPQLRFSLRNDAFPLLTTKKVFTKAIFHELLWFVKGSTNGLDLSALGVKIWDGNGSRAYLDSIGHKDRAVGDLGPVYGFQWRHFGAPYLDCHTDYSGQGIDQLASCIDKIKHSPYDRRIIMSAWNPADLGAMALPPCHMFCQFFVSFPNASRSPVPPTGVNTDTASNGTEAATSVGSTTTSTTTTSTSSSSSNGNGSTTTDGDRGRGELSCLLYQRSCDMGLGVPFNIASYALLTRMVAAVCDMDAGDLIHTMGDAHVYADHIDALKVQLERAPHPFPVLRIREYVHGNGTDTGGNDKASGGGGGDYNGRGAGEGRHEKEARTIDDFKYEDFVVEGYTSWPAIKMNMSV